MTIRVLQWNISTRCKPDSICSFLSSHLTDKVLINLQEVTANSYDKIVDLLKPTSSVLSLDLRKPGKHEGKNRQMGVSTLSFGLQITSYDLLQRSVFPERTLFTNLKIGNQIVTILNFHSITGVDYKKAKSSNFATIADFMEENDSVIDFACFDANEPMVDSMDYNEIECWDNRDKGYNAGLILGKNKVHNLNDSYVTYLTRKGHVVKANPIIVSHKTGSNERRYDYIFSSDRWTPEFVSYQYEESIKATSDHSIVIGDFTNKRS